MLGFPWRTQLGAKLNPLPPDEIPEFVVYTKSGKPLKTKSEKYIKLKKVA